MCHLHSSKTNILEQQNVHIFFLVQEFMSTLPSTSKQWKDVHITKKKSACPFLFEEEI